MGVDTSSPHYEMFDVLHEKWASIAYSPLGPGGPGVASAIKTARARKVCELQDTWESNRLVASLLGVSEATVRNWVFCNDKPNRRQPLRMQVLNILQTADGPLAAAQIERQWASDHGLGTESTVIQAHLDRLVADGAAAVTEDGRYHTHLQGTAYEDQSRDRHEHVRAMVDIIVEAGLRYLEEGSLGQAEVRAYAARMSPSDQLAFQDELRAFARERLQFYEDRSGGAADAVAFEVAWAATRANTEEGR
mgnify:CR=1 FL=1